MSVSPTLGWLICCLLFILGAVIVAAIIFRRHLRADAANCLLPDFVVIDKGQHIHFVPVGEDAHLLDQASRCPCRPLCTWNHRRSGRGTVYVDHHTLLPTSTRSALQYSGRQLLHPRRPADETRTFGSFG